MLLASVSFAQFTTRNDAAKPLVRHNASLMTVSPKAAGDTVSVFPWNEGFETTMYNWTLLTENASGDNGFVINSNSVYAHTGSYCLFGTYSDDVNTNQWAISPVIALPTDATDFTLRFFVQTTVWEGIPTHYEVRISTTGAATSDFTTLLYEETDSTGSYEMHSVSLGAFAGQQIRIAFHNITAMGGDAMMIDDIRIGGPEPPMMSLAGPTTIVLGESATFVVTSNSDNLTWYVDDTELSETSATLTYTFTAAGSHQVVAKATNSVGDTYDTLNVNVIDCGGPISVIPFSEGFEAEIPCWYFVSADPANDAHTGLNTEHHSGDFSYALSSYSMASDYNQFLITPELNLPTEGDYMVSFWYKGYVATDAFRVKVSTSTHDTAAFTTMLGEYNTVATEWTRVAFALPSGTKYVAINYYGDYAYYLYIDDFSIDQMGAPFVTIAGPASIGTGMEATFTADVNLADNVAWYVDGTAVNTTGNTMTTTFTTAGIHTVRIDAINSHGTASDSILVDVFSCDGFTAPYTALFTTSLGCWSNRSDSTQGYGWMLSADAFESNPVGQVISFSAQDFFGMMMIDVPVDNWLISPWITMPDEGNFDIAYKVRAYTAQYAADHYGVYVIDQNGNETLLREGTLGSTVNHFSQRTASIPSDIRGQFRFAFRHFNSQGGYAIILDDIKIVAAGSLQGIDDVNNVNVSVYPNPANDVLNIQGERISEVQLLDLSGRTVMTASNAGSLNISSLPASVYMVRVVTADGIYTQKVVKY